MVGNVGSDLRYEYTALGDAMNVAARMQTAAEPGTILITEMTRRLTGDAFDVEDLGAIEVKGKAEPVHAYRVVGRKAAPARRRGLESVGLDSPMVGRDAPLAELLRAARRRPRGRGRVAFVVGEPGIGKSRLLAELTSALAAGDASRRRPGSRVAACRTAATCRTTSLIDLVRSILGIPFAATGGRARARRWTRAIARICSATIRRRPRTRRPYLAHLLACRCADEEQERVAKLEPDVLQGRYVAAIHPRSCVGSPTRGPVVLVCEDLHWADPASDRRSPRQLMPLAAQLPILVVGGAPRRDATRPAGR